MMIVFEVLFYILAGVFLLSAVIEHFTCRNIIMFNDSKLWLIIGICFVVLALIIGWIR